MIKQNILHIENRIDEIAKSCGRDPQHIKLVAVSKRFPAGVILEAQDAGHFLFGENYIQEAQEKYVQLDKNVKMHFIGHLQSNKAKTAAEMFTMIETIDRLKLAKALNKHLENIGKKLDVLIQVNVGGEEQKSGVSPDLASELAEQISQLPMLRLRGLMTMPPFALDPEDSRPFFSALREIAFKLNARGIFLNQRVELSMGMTNDFHIAIQEGATLIRIGTAIFGERPPKA